MLLTRLAEYARENTDSAPFHREREFTWRLDLSTDDRPARLTDIRQPDAKGKLRGQKHTTPAVTRTVGVAPNLGADDVQYVFGWGDDTTRPARVTDCHTQFVALISAWANAAQDDPAAAAVREFYQRQEYIDWPVPAGCKAKQGVLLAVDGELITRRPSLQRFWTEEVTRRKGSKNSGHGLCLVCGQTNPLLESMPGMVAKRLVPGAGNDVALVSVNELVFGYGLTMGLRHTPICFSCGDAVNTGLTHLLGSQHATVYPGQDSIMTWWVVGAPAHDIFDVMPRTADPDAVNRLLSKLHSGALEQAAELAQRWDSDQRFCSVTLGGNASRIMIREWTDMPLAAVARNLALWYDHMLMVSPRQDAPIAHGLWNLLLATGRWEASRDRSSGRYVGLDSNSGHRPQHIQRDLLARALRGIPLPPSVLHHVLHRIASDGHIDILRAALLRLALCRPDDKEPRVSPGLDQKSHDTAYVSGRIFAQLEKIQYHAHDGQLNTTFGDRYFAGAIGNPTPALLAGRKLAASWLSKIRRRPTTRSKAFALAQELDDLQNRLDHCEPLTGHLPPAQQAQFVLGYHQQRAFEAKQRREYQADNHEPGKDA